MFPAGESAGGGSVMLQTMAYGGSLGTTLFENVGCETLTARDDPF